MEIRESNCGIERSILNLVPNMDETQAIQAAQNGDLAAFNRLVMAYQGMAYNVAYRIVGDADEVIQGNALKASIIEKGLAERVVNLL